MNFVQLPSGESVEGQEVIAFKTPSYAKKYVYLMAGTHGDEPEGVYLLEQLFEWLRKKDLEKDLVVIPKLNPDGLSKNSRTNANGVDLNRNYPSDQWTSEAREERYFPGSAPLSEPENVFLDSLFQKHPPKLIISLHSWKPFINSNGGCLKEAQLLAKHNKYEIVDEDIEGHPTPGSLGEYAPQRYESPVLTFECPVASDDLSFEDIWKENEKAFKKLLTSKLI